MNADTEFYHQRKQNFHATWFILKKNKFTLNFMKEWLEYSQDYRLITDSPNECGLLNYPEFSDHRHDQSILSCLIASSQVQVSFFPPGFFGSGLDNGALKPGDAWIIHGEVEALSVAKMSQFFSKAKTFIYHKFELGLFLFMQQRPEFDVLSI